MNITPLEGTIGAAVTGLDLGRPIAQDDAAALRVALAARGLLIVRDPGLAPDGQRRFVEVFANVVDEGGDGRGYVYVSNYREDGVLAAGKPLLFHADNVFTPEPLAIVSLYGERVAPGGAPTRFASAVDACARLSTQQRTALEGQTALNVSGFAGGWYRYRDADVAPHHPRAVHPVITEDTYGHRPALMVSEQQTDRIEGWGPDDSEAMLQALFALLYEPANVYVHEWREGDLVLWDNLALQHGRPPLQGAGERTLRRVAGVTAGAASQRAWTKVSRAAEAQERAGR